MSCCARADRQKTISILRHFNKINMRFLPYLGIGRLVSIAFASILISFFKIFFNILFRRNFL